MNQQFSILNLFRFLAAVFVVIHHFTYNIPPFNEGALGRIVKNGHFSVTFFFVLSGFVMVLSTRNVDFYLWKEKVRFWKKRAIRLLPLYFLGLVLFVLFLILDKKGIKVNELIYNVFGIQAWSLNRRPEINPPAWSLSVEYCFYIITPFVIILFGALKSKTRFISSLMMWLLTIIIFLFLVYNFNGKSSIFNFFPLLHLSSFIIGVTLGFYWIKRKHEGFSKTHYLLSFFVLIALCFAFNSNVFHGMHIGIYAPLFGCVIYLTVLAESFYNPKIPKKIFNFLGDLSYPIYILHWPLVNFANLFIGPKMGVVWLMKYLLYLLVCCVIVNLTIEKVAKRWYAKV